jgi:hypothetical protein
MAAPAGMRVFFLAQLQRPVRVAQYPSANRAEGASYSFGIMVAEVSVMAVPFVVVKAHHLVGMLYGLGELACPALAIAGKRVRRLIQTSGAAQPLRPIHAVPSSLRSSSSWASRSDDRGGVEMSSSP